MEETFAGDRPMSFIQIPKPWQLPERDATPESAYWHRRKFIKMLVGAGIGASAGSLKACQQANDIDPELRQTLGQPLNQVTANPNFQDAGRAVTAQQYASSYNNFYEFGGTKKHLVQCPKAAHRSLDGGSRGGWSKILKSTIATT